MKKLLFLVMLGSLIISLSNCKKDKNTSLTIAHTCHAISSVKIDSIYTDSTNYVWNSAGKLIAIRYSDGYTDSISYANGFTYINQYNNTGTYYSTSTFTLNTDGHVTKLTSYDIWNSWDSSLYIYDANGYESEKNYYGSNGSVSRVFFNMAGANLASIVSTGSSAYTATYEYFTDKLDQGDPRYPLDTYFGKRNKNLISKVTVVDNGGGNGSYVSTFTYVIDNNGNQTRMIETPTYQTVPIVNNYTWSCN